MSITTKPIDRFTGKPVDKLSDLLPSVTRSQCDECDEYLINRCPRCGAPVCCPKCCRKAESEARP